MSEPQVKPPTSRIESKGDNYGAIGVFNEEVHIHINAPLASKRERQTLLRRVRNDWIKGILEQSIEGATFIPLGLYQRPDLIENPWASRVQEARRTKQQLPLGTSLIQVYDKAEGELLILGEPGSGKTTLLLNLARELLERAERDETLPMPVVFNLSTWADKRLPLPEWLVEELSDRYQIPHTLGKPWVVSGQVFPLLDGLDEVAAEHRAACIGAINAYRKTLGQLPLVIGSRLAEYSALATKAIVRQAVLVQPMTLPQIHEYLAQADAQLDSLQELLRDEPDFQELAKNPLMLSILKRTYQGKEIRIARNASLEERRHQVFNDYVQRVFEHRSVGVHYSPEQTKHWLIWLARQMKQRDQPGFYLERLQIDWLAKSRPCELYTSLAFGFLSFPIAASVYALEYSVYGVQFGLVRGILAGLMTAIVAFFFVLFIETNLRVSKLFSKGDDQTATVRPKKQGKMRAKLAAIFTPIFVERIAFALLSGLLEGILVEFLVGPLYASINGLFLAAFLIVLGKFERKIQPAETLVWTWKSLRKHAVVSWSIGLAIGAFGGVFNGFPYLQHMSVFLPTLYFWLSLGAALGIIIMLMRGFTSNELDTELTIKPNQGIRNSLSNSLRLGLSSGTLLGLVVFFFYSYVIHNIFVVGYINEIAQNAYFTYGVGDALAVAYLFWLINGGFATVQHLILRVLLWQTKCAPWRYPRFLNYAQERILLRKVGGGYTFIHLLLRDYFANLGTDGDASTPPATGTQSEMAPAASVLSSDEEEQSEGETPTAALLLMPVLSDTPVLLSCGHEQRDPSARFCSICGRKIASTSLDE